MLKKIERKLTNGGDDDDVAANANDSGATTTAAAVDGTTEAVDFLAEFTIAAPSQNRTVSIAEANIFGKDLIDLSSDEEDEDDEDDE